jgi:hypothetical protein
MDLSKLSRLSAAPWTHHDDGEITAGNGGCIAQIQYHGNTNTVARTGEAFNSADGDFIVLARAAFAGDPEALAWWEANRVHPQEIQP